ncbi:hypothetical protein HanXRQr2_Chr11g0519111 [Helianthus annuus]|uniref:Uncharacterized protein n=1 Tax=Helianthus annuus TaxID=4232 RepID=A0A9K3HTJ1_HELAN|nr:hypothetical protein HanXRQr2_Chr11g0519111 [Helianthus annuus]
MFPTSACFFFQGTFPPCSKIITNFTFGYNMCYCSDSSNIQ